MKSPDALGTQEQIPQDEEAPIETAPAEVTEEEIEKNTLEAEIQEVQTELLENVDELNADAQELEGLEGEEGFSEKAKNLLKAGLSELKDFVLANPIINTLAGIYVGSDALRGVFDSITKGEDIKEVATKVLGQAAFFGVAKAVAYIGWGRKGAQEGAKKAEEAGEVEEVGPQADASPEAQPLQEAEAAPKATENVEEEIKKLKDIVENEFPK